MKVIKEMSTYYSLAIQRHPESVEQMSDAIWSGYYHKISTDSNPQHHLCDPSWCSYLQHKNENKPYNHKPPICPSIQNHVKEIYTDLTDKKLLSRCLGRNTQNSNECFNSTAWQFVPKHTFNGKITVETSVWMAAIIFNEGMTSILKMMDGLGIEVQGNRRSTNQTKKVRASQQKQKSALEDNYEEVEGLLYAPGIDSDW